MLKEFKEFAIKGNVLDLAIGVVVGGAFGKIVTSLVNDIIMPPIGLLIGKVDFSNLFISLSKKQYHSVAEAKAAGAATINYGLFLNTIIDFLIVSFSIFLVLQQLNRFRRKEEPEESKEETKDCPFCLSKIPLLAVKCAHCTSVVEERALPDSL